MPFDSPLPAQVEKISSQLVCSGPGITSNDAQRQGIPARVTVTTPAPPPGPREARPAARVAVTAVHTRCTRSRGGTGRPARACLEELRLCSGAPSAKQLEQPAHLGRLRLQEGRASCPLSLAARSGHFHWTRERSPVRLERARRKERAVHSLWDADVSVTPAVGGEEQEGPLGPLSCAHGGLRLLSKAARFGQNRSHS